MTNWLDYKTCPWDNFSPATIHFCEKQLCSWIVKPAETWSNIGFSIIGLWVFYLAKKENHPHLAPIGVIGILLGIFSALFHATGTFWGEYLDVTSMILFVSLGLAFNLKRTFVLNYKKTDLIFVLVVGFCLILMYFIRPIGIPLFGILFTTTALIEWNLFRKAKNKADYRFFKAMAYTFLLAWAIWWLDLTKIVCDPDNHIFNGHAFWHLACALNFYFVYRFMSQFDELKRT